MSAARLVLLVLATITGLAHADPAAAPPPVPVTTAPIVITDPLPAARPVPSLRVEAARVAAERFSDSWRYPEPGPLFGNEGGLWYLGYGAYAPRSRRAAALHGGSVAATLIGEILMAADSPLAGVGAMITGATLDAAAAEADHAAEAAQPTRPTR